MTPFAARMRRVATGTAATLAIAAFACEERIDASPLAARPPEPVVMPPASPGAAEAVRLPLRASAGSPVTGTASAEELPDGVQLRVSVTAPRGFYAVHLRDRPDCADVAGPDRHPSDRGRRLGVLAVEDGGSATFEHWLEAANLDSPAKGGSLFGRSLILFRQDHTAPPRGDGERAVACGPISR